MEMVFEKFLGNLLTNFHPIILKKNLKKYFDMHYRVVFSNFSEELIRFAKTVCVGKSWQNTHYFFTNYSIHFVLWLGFN